MLTGCLSRRATTTQASTRSSPRRASRRAHIITISPARKPRFSTKHVAANPDTLPSRSLCSLHRLPLLSCRSLHGKREHGEGGYVQPLARFRGAAHVLFLSCHDGHSRHYGNTGVLRHLAFQASSPSDAFGHFLHDIARGVVHRLRRHLLYA